MYGDKIKTLLTQNLHLQEGFDKLEVSMNVLSEANKHLKEKQAEWEFLREKMEAEKEDFKSYRV